VSHATDPAMSKPGRDASAGRLCRAGWVHFPANNPATLASGSQSVSTGTVVPQQTEGFSYDAAGNLTADGQ